MVVRRTLQLSAEDLRIRDLQYDLIGYLSITLCVMILITAAILSIHPSSKPKTDRVSFRIMIYALAGTLIYLVSSLLANRIPGQIICRVVGSFSVFALNVSTFLFFCIGLNLQLVMIHGVDGTKAEKYYVVGSISLAIMLGFTTYISKQLVYSSERKACYYYNPDNVAAFWWKFGIRLIWNFLAMAGELVTFTSIVIYMARVKVFESSPSRETTNTSGLSASHQYRKPLGPKQYRRFVYRIALYPLSSLATSGVMAIGTLTSSTVITTRADFYVLTALRNAYLVRGAIYAVVAAVDPAITQGVRLLYRHYTQRGCSFPPFNGTSATIRPAIPRPSSRVEIENLTAFKNSESIRWSFLRESGNTINLPSLPKKAMLPSHRENHLGASSDYTSIYTNGESRAVDSVRYPYLYPQLRHL